MPITDPKCPNCHAHLPLSVGAKMLTCQYCGNQVMLKPAQPAPAPPPVVQQPPVIRMPRGAQSRPVRVHPLIILLPILGVLAGIGVTVYLVTSGIKKATRHARQTQQVVARTQAQAAERVAQVTKQLRVRAYWSDGNLIRTARINGDEVDDVLLLGRYTEDSGGTFMYLTAFDGATFKRLYRAGPFGDVQQNQAMTRTKFAITGRHVVLTDHKSTARVLDLGTGKELRAVGLTDRAEFVCADPKVPDRVWIEMSDKKHVAMAATSAALTPAPKQPWWCPRWSDRVGCRAIGGEHVCRRGHRVRVRPKGFHAGTSFAMDGRLYALGTRHPGTRRPMVASYDLRARKVRWLRGLVTDVTAAVAERAPEHASAAQGRLVLDYKLGRDDQRLTALNGDTGETVWDVPLPLTGHTIKHGADAIVASPTRVFVVSRGVIMFFDAGTGEKLGETSEST